MTAPTVYDRMCWPTGLLEHALATGAHQRELHAYLGDDEYALLTRLARRAAGVTASPDAPSVYLLPGILGSQLGTPHAPPTPPDLLWLDPDDIVNGRLVELRPRSEGKADAGLQPLGVVVHNYLPLRLRLAAAGLRAVLFDYDWRQDLLVPARTLAAKLDQDPAAHIVLVGHSMGGLLARAALPLCAQGTQARIRLVIGVGTPHGGSMAAVQALRATYPVILRLAAMDRLHDARTLTTDAFRHFHSLYQMLPAALPEAPDSGSRIDLFQTAAWPADGVVPDPQLLRLAQSFHARLAGADRRFVAIVGTGKRTVTGIGRDEHGFRYEVSSAGDGTVAISRAKLAGARIYSLRCEHSELPRSPRVAAAIIDLLRGGDTKRLNTGVIARPGRRIHVDDRTIREELERKIDWHRLSIAQRRRYLDHLSDPPLCYRPAPKSPPDKKL
ncbi:MAG TPA: hypothetical protein VHZ99_02970 [Steroidobacteraceae bacterium]|nr:hypothetical protein [Steroidobacteraceae bacterium]